VDYCVQKNITPRLGTIADITKECFKNSPIKQRTCDENGDWSEKDITGDVAVRFESDKLTLARIIDKIECRAQEIDNAKYEENKKQLQKDSVPDLMKLTTNLHRLNIVDGKSYLRFTSFLMQTVYRLFHEIDNDDKTCIFMNGVGRDGKSSTCQAILKVFSKYGRVHKSKGVKVFEEKHELKLQAAHLSFIDEANPCGVCRELLFNAVNGGDVEIEPKNQNKITIKSNTNYLLKNLHSGDILITTEISRLGRSLLEVMHILETCLNKNCQVWTIKENYRLGNDIQSKVMAFAFGISAEIERQLISERTKAALESVKNSGKKLGRPFSAQSKKLKLTKNTRKIQKLLSAGVSQNKISQIMGVQNATLRRFLKRMKLK